jgi:hypothetical protein
MLYLVATFLLADVQEVTPGTTQQLFGDLALDAKCVVTRLDLREGVLKEEDFQCSAAQYPTGNIALLAASGRVAVPDLDFGEGNLYACGEISAGSFSKERAELILLAKRGQCSFAKKAAFAESLGYAGLVIVDNNLQPSSPNLQNDDGHAFSKFPVVMVGSEIEAIVMKHNVSLMLTLPQADTSVANMRWLGKTKTNTATKYASACARATKTDGGFAKFKRDGDYTPVLEHVMVSHGELYIRYINDTNPWLLSPTLLESFRKNDQVTRAAVLYTGELLAIAAGL